MMICCGMAVKRMGLLEVSVRKMKALFVKKETVTLNYKGGCNLTCFVYKVFKSNSEIFFLSRHFFWGGGVVS